MYSANKATFASIFVFVLLTSALPELSIVPTLRSQTVDQNLWVPNGPVYAIHRSGNTIYVGGAFSYVGPSTGGGAAIDLNTSNPNLAFAKANGAVYAVAPDGSGGWFIGGYFTNVGGVSRNHLARINADGTLNSSWDPNANSEVWALVVAGPTVYVGGRFTSVGGSTRNRIAALDAATGQVTSWNPNAGGGIFAISVTESTVYAGGEFITIGGETRNYVAALDKSTGYATGDVSNLVELWT